MVTLVAFIVFIVVFEGTMRVLCSQNFILCTSRVPKDILILLLYTKYFKIKLVVTWYLKIDLVSRNELINEKY